MGPNRELATILTIVNQADHRLSLAVAEPPLLPDVSRAQVVVLHILGTARGCVEVAGLPSAESDHLAVIVEIDLHDTW